ncbi:DUF4249 domain-containing protein [Mucilaginibacter ginsenosidivorans]|uniref:DUF4249 domain-containing protein n=1 Tax=Mucilaginibacter ginsenosidivorans TaxID=398053 RepID=A0A5B8URP1_9SPHI|nr:DUF4249 domain-containing protein [Mucilaginibacter ginsenosidivorans]QEC61385.1 DUF4249 domain-containing protein [Mucilaginibacter ginsenosidivorans]
MKSIIVVTSVFILAIAMAWGCKKPYLGPAIVSKDSYLVIEGLINTGPDSTFIKLTRTVKLSDIAKPSGELNATVTIEGDNNSSYQLTEAGGGLYQSPPLYLGTNAKYRLRVKTASNEEYLSDFVEAKETPDIDSVSYEVQNDGVQFYVNSHDAANKTRYYRWDFDETWGYHAFARSYFKIGGDGYPELRVAPEDKIYGCYRSNPGVQILTATTTKLSQDVVLHQPLDFISQGSGKISHGYSLLLRQYALTEAGYSYWENLKKNTEEIGSIFDAQPSELPSNIHCLSEPGKPVIGFVSASSVKSKRVFVNNFIAGLFVPDYIAPPTADECKGGAILIEPQVSFQYRLKQLTGTGDTVLLNGIYNRMGVLLGYGYAARNCADCRTKAPYGTNLAPAFWPIPQRF